MEIKMDKHLKLQESVKMSGWRVTISPDYTYFKLLYDRTIDMIDPVPDIVYYDYNSEILSTETTHIKSLYLSILDNNYYDDKYDLLSEDEISEDVVVEVQNRKYICDNFLLKLLYIYSSLYSLGDNSFIKKRDYYTLSDMFRQSCYFLRVTNDLQNIKLKVNIEGFKNFNEFYRLLKLKAYHISDIKDKNTTISEYIIPISKLDDWFNTIRIYKK